MVGVNKITIDKEGCRGFSSRTNIAKQVRMFCQLWRGNTWEIDKDTARALTSIKHF